MIKSKNYVLNALSFCLCSSMEYKHQHEVIASLNTRNTLIHSKFRYSIAKDIANYLISQFPDQIKNINIYGSTMDYNADIYSDIDLLIKTSHLDQRIVKTLKRINILLSYNYYKLISKNWRQESRLLDIHIINDDPAKQKCPSRDCLEYILVNNSIPLGLMKK